MNINEIYKTIKNNHLLLMLVCCLVPLAILYFAVSYFGVKQNYLYLFIILLCPIMHIFMMHNMHKGHDGHDDEKSNKKNNENYTKGGCH